MVSFQSAPTYEWPEIKEDITSRTDAVTRSYKLPAKVFKLYKSAEVHTVQQKRKPIAFYASLVSVLIAILAIGSVGYRLYHTFSGESVKTAKVETGVGASAPAPVSDLADTSTPTVKKVLTASEIIKSLTPVIVGLPWTAPFYQELAKPVSFPQIKGCIATQDKKRCACYSQQATIIDMPYEVCLLYLKRGSFNHFQPDKSGIQQVSNQPEAINFVSSQTTTKPSIH